MATLAPKEPVPPMVMMSLFWLWTAEILSTVVLPKEMVIFFLSALCFTS